MYGALGAFQGDLSLLSTRSVIETCVVQVLLYGCENWILSDVLIDQLNCLLGELPF